MSKNKIIALILSIIFIYEFCMFALSMYEYYNAIKGYKISNMSFSFSFYFNPFIYVFNLIAILQFVISKFKRSILLRIFLLYTIFSSFIFFPIWTIESFFITELHRPQTLDSMYFVRYVLSFIAIVFNIFVLHNLVSNIKPQLIPLGDGSSTFDEVSKWQRFSHRILDLSAVALVIYPSFDYIARFLMKILESSNTDIPLFFESKSYFYALVYLLMTIYYIVTEGIFNTSIGKTILGNVITNSTAEKPSFVQRIGRAFMRLVPFDAFSFLFISRGWHDGITGTYVVKAENFSE